MVAPRARSYCTTSFNEHFHVFLRLILPIQADIFLSRVSNSINPLPDRLLHTRIHQVFVDKKRASLGVPVAY